MVNKELEQRLLNEIRSSPTKRAFVYSAHEIEYVRGCDRFEIVERTREGWIYIVAKEN